MGVGGAPGTRAAPPGNRAKRDRNQSKNGTQAKQGNQAKQHNQSQHGLLHQSRHNRQGSSGQCKPAADTPGSQSTGESSGSESLVKKPSCSPANQRQQFIKRSGSVEIKRGAHAYSQHTRTGAHAQITHTHTHAYTDSSMRTFAGGHAHTHTYTPLRILDI